MLYRQAEFLVLDITPLGFNKPQIYITIKRTIIYFPQQTSRILHNHQEAFAKI